MILSNRSTKITMPSSRRLICCAPKPLWTWRWHSWKSQKPGKWSTMPLMPPTSPRLARLWPRWIRMIWWTLKWVLTGSSWTLPIPGLRFKLHQLWRKQRQGLPRNGSITPHSQTSSLQMSKRFSMWMMLVTALQILWVPLSHKTLSILPIRPKSMTLNKTSKTATSSIPLRLMELASHLISQ